MSETSTAYNPTKHNLHRVSGARLFIRALGISFFSLLSISMAFYAFVELPQVQDLLFDARPYWTQEAVYWTGFYLIGIFIWALPLVFTARLLLLQNFDVIGIDSEERFNFYIFRLPSFLVVLAFAAVLGGIILAGDNLPVPLKDGGNQYEAPIRTFLEAHLITLFIASAFVLLLVLLRDLFIHGYGRSMEHMERKDPEGFKKTLIRIERLTRKQSLNLDNLDLHLTALKPDFLSQETWIASQRVKEFMWRYMIRITWILLVLVAIHFLSYSELVQRIFTIPDLSSYPSLQNSLAFIADTLSIKRASFLFVIFGAWLPFVTLLAALSNRFQFPFITALIILGASLTLLISDGHDVRVVQIPQEQQAALKPVSFPDAVKQWKIASGWNAKGCETPTAPPSCPRPIIVAGEGGGSRAAFLLASVLGALEDDSLDKQKNPTARPFHQQLFAISSVSGSSVGAAFFVSALKAQPNVTVDDLKKALFRQRLWFPNVATANPAWSKDQKSAGNAPVRFLTDFVTYKDALQAALSNDFISPTVTAFLARDVLMLSRLPFVFDRAGILETAWEDSFNGIYGTSRATSPLSGPLQAMSPSPGSWTPLLFLNATSIETGRRVIVTPVKIAEPIAGTNSLFIDAYDLHELLCSPYIDPKTNSYPDLRILDEIARTVPAMFSPVADAKCDGRKPTSIDLRLSTAAGTSSRSPFVSPHAGIRDRRAQITDSVVDGGYFDNSGVVTAFEIAKGLKAVDPRLQPFILQVSSEPEWFKDAKNCSVDGTYSEHPLIPDEADFRPINSITDLLTVNATRIARGYETILELPEQAKQLNGGLRSVAQLHICPQPKESFFWDQFLEYTTKDAGERDLKRQVRIRQKAEKQAGFKSVSLSWWLSPPLQAFLDGQIYAKHNLDERNCVISLLKDTSTSEAASACP